MFSIKSLKDFFRVFPISQFSNQTFFLHFRLSSLQSLTKFRPSLLSTSFNIFFYVLTHVKLKISLNSPPTAALIFAQGFRTLNGGKRKKKSPLYRKRKNIWVGKNFLVTISRVERESEKAFIIGTSS